MKHTLRVTFAILCMFFLAQIIGLLVVNNYVDYQKLGQTGKISFKELPLGLEAPKTQGAESFFTIIFAVLIGTALALLLIRFRQHLLWKLWFLLAVFVTLYVAFDSFSHGKIALIAALVFAVWKIYWPNFYVHNFTELFIYGGLVAIFVNMLDLFAVILLLIAISAYDAYAVWKSGHMIKLAKFQTQSRLFAGVVIPYKIGKLVKTDHKKIKKVKIKTAILGGGDIGFPLLFSGVLFKELLLNNPVGIAFSKVLVVPVFATIALGWLLYNADKDKFYPAMPIISLGCFLAFFVMKFIGFI